MAERSALVTGAAGGIGRAAVELFLKEGWLVLAVDVDTPEASFPKAAEFLSADLSNSSDIEKLCNQVTKKLPDGLHALVNNAAVQITKSLSETSTEEWDRVHAVNLRAPFFLAKGFLPSLSKAKGAIVNVASVHAVATSAEIGVYASSKGGLLALTRAMAIEFAPDGIRANAVLPGATDTAMLDAGLNRDHVKGKDAQARKEDLAKKILLKRLGTPEEIARAIYFLADNEQSAYITGQSLVVDGGALARLSIE